MTNNDLISREALKKALHERYAHWGDLTKYKMSMNSMFTQFNTLIDKAPAVDVDDITAFSSGYLLGKLVEERPQGEWVLMYCSCGDRYYTCSICNRAIEVNNGQSLKDYPFCHCGAVMRGNEDD